MKNRRSLKFLFRNSSVIFFSAFDSNIKDHLSHILTNIYLDSLSESVARTYSKYQTGSCRIGAVED